MTAWWRWPNTIGLGPIDNSILAGSNPAAVNPKKNNFKRDDKKWQSN